MALKNIKLSEADQRELKDKLDAWRLQEKKKMQKELTEKYEQMEAQLKEEYAEAKEEYEELVEEIKENMKKVYTQKFTRALKEMYEEIKAEVMVEHTNSAEVKALEEVKAVVYPLLNESTAKRHKNEFKKLAEMYSKTLEDLEHLKGENKKARLLESLSPEVRKVVTKLLGEGTEQEIVEKFAAIKEALKEQAEMNAPALEEEKETTPSKNLFEDNDDDEEEVVVRRSVRESRKPARPQPSKVDQEFKNQLDEQLVLAGLKKVK